MGIEFIAAKGEKFGHQRDAAFEKLESENLLSRLPEQVVTVFRCRSEGDAKPDVGDRVLLNDARTRIEVLLSNRLVGVVMARDAAELRRIFGSPATAGAQVCEVSSDTRQFVVVLL